MEEQEVKALIQKELVEIEENYVPEKIYWQRTVRMIVIIASMMISLLGGMIAWGFKISTEVTNNTQARRDFERRLDNIESDNKKIIENYNNVAENQKEVLSHQQKLSRKLDVLIDKAGARYSE
jgi:hypothetical protein